jgi:hypothetical protein
MIKKLNEKELGHSFFYSLKINDFQHAYYVLQLGASVNTSYFIAKDELIYTISPHSLTQIFLSVKLHR